MECSMLPGDLGGMVKCSVIKMKHKINSQNIETCQLWTHFGWIFPRRRCRRTAGVEAATLWWVSLRTATSTQRPVGRARPTTSSAADSRATASTTSSLRCRCIVTSADSTLWATNQQVFFAGIYPRVTSSRGESRSACRDARGAGGARERRKKNEK